MLPCVPITPDASPELTGSSPEAALQTCFLPSPPWGWEQMKNRRLQSSRPTHRQPTNSTRFLIQRQYAPPADARSPAPIVQCMPSQALDGSESNPPLRQLRYGSSTPEASGT